MEDRIDVPFRADKDGIIRTWWRLLVRFIAALDSYSEYLLIRNELRLLKVYRELEKTEYKEEIEISAAKNVARVSKQLKTSMLMFLPLVVLLILIVIIF